MIFNKNGLIWPGLIFFLLIISLLIVFFTVRTPHPFLPLIVTIGLIVFIISFINTDFALTILIFSMLLSPELALGGMRGRAIVVRIDDILLMVIFLGWLAKMAVNKELGFLRVTPLNRPIIFYIFICLIATLWGALKGYVRLKESTFYFLKYFEYLLIYFMTVNCLKSIRQIKFFIYSMLVVALIISIYAWAMHFQGVSRVSAPFDEVAGGEPATLGGYLILIMTITIGLFLNFPDIKSKIFLAVVLFFSFPAFLFTLSRGSWFGFIPAYLSLIFLTHKGKNILFIVSVFLVIMFSTIFPKYVYERVKYTFEAQTERTVFGRRISVDESAAARIDSWEKGFKVWRRSPIIGTGVGGTNVIDNQYSRVLIELGVIGVIAALWLLKTIITNSLRNLAELKEDNFASGLIAGFIAGFVGLLGHSCGAATFIIIRIMEPFWFLTAIIVMLPHLDSSLEEKT